ncbi:MAG TPA: hypothetical protein VHX65_19570 [Pirellulales bacterium]|jgi:outer membrane protein assembly factor BamB|nr:hypothetical protein [Pirellulales bacterium]
MKRHAAVLGLVFSASLAATSMAADKPAIATVEQIISREDPSFNCAVADMTIGQDGMVYLTSAGHDSGYILRVGRDGHDKLGGQAVPAINNATADHDGQIASANGHFSHQVAFYDKLFQKTGAATDFLVSDQVGWDAPAGVEAGPSGDFYALDQHRNRIVRMSGQGKLIQSYPLPTDGKYPAAGFRVCEKLKAIFVAVRSAPDMLCIGFDSKVRWRSGAINAGVSTPWGDDGGFDVDENGTIYVIRSGDARIRKFDSGGKPAGEIQLQKPAQREAGVPIRGMRVWQGDLLLRFHSPSELFEVYDLASGKFKRSVETDHERLTVAMPSGPWIAGSTVDFRIDFDASGRRIRPAWRVWARAVGSLDDRELKIVGGAIHVPEDFAGLYRIKVTPETTPRQTGNVASEYKGERLIEVRAARAVSSVAVATPSNRLWFGRGEAIPFSILTNPATASRPGEISVSLVPEDGKTIGREIFAEASVPSAGANRSERSFVVPNSLTRRLRPGKYLLRVTAKDATCMNQPLVIGPALDDAKFFTIQYGDYAPTYPEANPWDAPNLVAATVERNRRLGFNLMVDRLGGQLDAVVGKGERAKIEAESQALAAEKDGVPAAKLLSLPAAVQTVAAYGASGMQQMAILMNNDAGLPLGTGFDGRKAPQLLDDLTTVTRAMKDFPAFRGWSWASNWWVFDTRGSAAAASSDERIAYDQAIKRAQATGHWDAVLDRVADRRLAYAADAEKLFADKLRELAPHEATAAACPFRNVESYPPTTLANVDETDLQAQWEQISLPLHGPMNVDFYKRPGKIAWGHPEVWNDAGTGEQILPVLWQMIMRGADGAGCSGSVPQWYFATKGNTDDARLSWNGLESVCRSLNGVLKRYGPWLAAMHNSDSVAIVASGRMFKIDDWTNVMGRHFARVMEAYAACLYAHRPASIVFAEDLRPDTLRQYRAVLVVGQTIEMEPALAGALQEAKRAGVSIFADRTCRPELVAEFTPLGIAFDKFEKDPSPASDDHAYWRFAAYAQADATRLAAALSAIKPAARLSNPEVFISERRSDQGRYLFVVNDTIPSELDPGNLWRVTLATASIVPQVVPLGIDVKPGEAVYDVFAGRRAIVEADGAIHADCRNSPARIYAILPDAIARVQLNASRQPGDDGALQWHAEVQNKSGKAIAAAVPLRIRLTAGDGSLLEERYVSSSLGGVVGGFIVPINAPSGTMSVEATELLTGESATLKVAAPAATIAPLQLTAEGAVAPSPLAREGRVRGSADPKPAANPKGQRTGDTTAADMTAVADRCDPDFSPADDSFGPHIRHLVVTDDGELAIMNAMNWDNNLYAIDLDTGKVRWRRRVGHYFAFEPIALAHGAAVQGFDLKSAEGYHLYLVGDDGRLKRRFALYGLPTRLPHRFVPGLVRDHINSFAVGDDGRWIATAGDLGAAAWSNDGKLLWRRDWFNHDRHSGKLLTIDAQSLLLIEGTTATAMASKDGAEKWRLSLGRSGKIRIARATADGKTLGLFNTADGGRLSIIRDGKLLREISTPVEDFSFSPDGSRIAVVSENALKLYSVADGLQWIFNGDDLMHFPRFSADGRLAATSGLGTLYVTDLTGRTLLERDAGALAVPAWLADGSLVLANWEGRVCRLDKTYSEKWRTHLQPEPADMRGKLLADDGVPTTRIAGWGNAAEPPRATPADIAANLLSKTTPLVSLVGSNGQMPLVETVDQKTSLLFDGKPSPPRRAWIPWETVGSFAETSPVNYLIVDAFRTRMKVAGVTFIEDPAHPESWLRDSSIAYWNAADERWVPVQPLLSNAPVHTHLFARPIEAARFRLKLPWGACGNLRLAQIIFHGEVLGCSHPDVVARRPLAVLFDEQEDIKNDLTNVSFALEGAYSGGRCLTVIPPSGGMLQASPPFRQQFGETIRNWDFRIAQHPEPGQYRYLQFAWKSLSPQTRGMTLRLSPSNYGGISFAVGEATAMDGATLIEQAGAPPAKWQTVRVDLWASAKKPWQVRSLCLAAKGGGAAFDQIVLGRTEADLPKR